MGGEDGEAVILASDCSAVMQNTREVRVNSWRDFATGGKKSSLKAPKLKTKGRS